MRKQVMLNDLPRYYYDSRIVDNLMEQEGATLDKLYEDIIDIRNQLFIDTATWGLEMWERFCGIPTDLSQSYASRREVIKAKLRGVGTVTRAMIESVAEAYEGGDVQVIEQLDQYRFVVKFISTRGIPANLDSLKEVINEIKPAHLSVVYEFTYLSFGELDASGVTFGDIDAANLTFGELEVWNPIP